MNQTPKSFHDDGIFRFEQELTFGETSVVDYAKRVVADDQEHQRQRYRRANLKVPAKIPLSIEDFRASLINLVEKKGYYAPSLETTSSRQEHSCARALESFFEWPMPCYCSDQAMLRMQGDHCWKIAVLNAFRVFDMMGDESIPLPHFWQKIRIEKEDPNFATLLASAACQMGRYHAMALAADSAPAAMRGRKMSGARKGKNSPLGMIIQSACKQISSERGVFPARVRPEEVMTVLVEQGHASMENSHWRILVENEWQDIDGKKLGAHISRFRKSLST